MSSSNEQKLDRNDFLTLLRASQHTPEEIAALKSNDDTFGASNTSRNQNGSSGATRPSTNLSELFAAPSSTNHNPAVAPETVGPQAQQEVEVDESQSTVPPLPPPLPSGAGNVTSDGTPTSFHKRNNTLSPPRSRPRGVSWGSHNAVELTSALSTGSNQDSSIEDTTQSAPAAVGHQDRQNSTGSYNSRRGGQLLPRGGSNIRKGPITLEDVLSPGAGSYEAEAENAILMALDRQRKVNRHRSNQTGSSTIFSQVPDGSLHEFDMPSSKSGDEEEENEDEETGSGTIGSSNRSLERQQKPLLQRNANAHHVRNQSVEQTLVDLTQAMMAINNHSKRTEHSAPTPVRTSDTCAETFVQNGIRIADQHENASNNKPVASTPELAPVPEIDVETGSGAVTGGSDDTREGADSSDGDAPGEKKTKRRNQLGILKRPSDQLKEDLEAWNDFFRPRREQVWAYFKAMMMYFLFPLVGIGSILFYLADNPPTGTDDEERKTAGASASFILIFCARQIITLSLAFAMQGIVIDFLALNTRVFLRFVGPIITLLIVQSKGWPQIAFWWCIFDFTMLAGDHAFAHHWLYFGPIGVFNADNPSGNIVDNYWYLRILIITVTLSVVVAIKRFVIGLYLGRQTYSHYSQQLASVMNKMVLVSKVAELAKMVETSGSDIVDSEKAELVRGVGFLDADEEDSHSYPSTKSGGGDADLVIDPDNRDPLTGSLHFTEKMKLMRLLDQWEEPVRHEPSSDEIASISAVLRFRKALTFIQQRYPFSKAFGLADSRESCVESAQRVYTRLIKHAKPLEVLHFERIAVLAVSEKGDLDQMMAKDLIKLFRPDRQGFLTMVDFIRSVDSVYKEFRLLDATIQNSSQIDRAFENIFNVVFYTIAFTVVLSALGFDPMALFLSMSSIILAFAFMIGNASAKYFEGILFILVRRPYGIGDRVSVAPVEAGASLDGVFPWVVQHVTLFETVLTCLPTNETASLSNGSLASSRIVNWARSPQAQFHIILHFPLNTPYEKLVIFKMAVEEYIKARPREWRALNGFRANRVFGNQNYLEFFIVIQHREAWQEVGLVLDSKANFTSYCQEVTEQLGLQYQAPPLPVDLRYSGMTPTGPTAMAGGDKAEGDMTTNRDRRASSIDVEALTREFQSVARNKHQIRVC